MRGKKFLSCRKKLSFILCIEGINTSNYKHAQNIWNILNTKSLGHYHDLYLQSNIIFFYTKVTQKGDRKFI